MALLFAWNYRLYRHTPPLFSPANYAGNPVNIFGHRCIGQPALRAGGTWHYCPGNAGTQSPGLTPENGTKLAFVTIKDCVVERGPAAGGWRRAKPHDVRNSRGVPVILFITRGFIPGAGSNRA